jgi:8-oxo-dGTP diphosphatase
VREAAEETGLTVELSHLIGLYHLRRAVADDGLRFVFTGHVVGGTLAVPATDEIAELGWFDPGALPAPMTDTGPLGVQDAVAGRAGVLRVLSV